MARAGTRRWLAAALTTLAATPAEAEERFVAPGGDDAAVGSRAAPWATLQHAADRARPGDTVRVRAGRYRGFSLRVGGTEAAPTRFVGEPGAVIDRDNPDTADGINLEGVAWVEVAGFEVVGATRAGIRAVDCAAVTIRGNRVVDAGTWGVFTGFCDDLLVEGNDLDGTRRQHCVYLSNSGDRPVVRGNRAVGCAQAGIQLNGDASAGGDGVITGAWLDGNEVRGAGARGAAAINLDGVVGAEVRNNLLVDNRSAGIAIFRTDGGAPSTDNRVINNTVVMAARSRWAVLLRDGATGTVLVNNVLLAAHPRRGAVDVDRASFAGLVSDHNAVTPRFTLDAGLTVLDLDGWRRRTGQDAASSATTEEEALAGARHEPRPGGPLVDRGRSADAPPGDLRGRARPAGAAPDVGALEACGAAPCALAPPPPAARRSGEAASAASRVLAPARPGRAGCGGAAAVPVVAAVGWAARRRRRGGRR